MTTSKENNIDDDNLYLEMLDLLENKEKREILLNSFSVKLNGNIINIPFTDLKENEKINLAKLIIKGKKGFETRRNTHFHNCKNCLYWVHLNGELDNPYIAKQCKYISSNTRKLLYDDTIKCPLYTKVEVK
jgi:hypothetical protein